MLVHQMTKTFISAQNELINKIKIKFNKKSLPLPKIININNKKKLNLNNDIEIH